MILILIITADAIIIAWPAAAEATRTPPRTHELSPPRHPQLALTLIFTLHLSTSTSSSSSTRRVRSLGPTCLPTPTRTRDNARTSSAWTAAAVERLEFERQRPQWRSTSSSRRSSVVAVATAGGGGTGPLAGKRSSCQVTTEPPRQRGACSCTTLFRQRSKLLRATGCRRLFGGTLPVCSEEDARHILEIVNRAGQILDPFIRNVLRAAMWHDERPRRLSRCPGSSRPAPRRRADDKEEEEEEGKEEAEVVATATVAAARRRRLRIGGCGGRGWCLRSWTVSFKPVGGFGGGGGGRGPAATVRAPPLPWVPPASARASRRQWRKLRRRRRRRRRSWVGRTMTTPAGG